MTLTSATLALNGLFLWVLVAEALEVAMGLLRPQGEAVARRGLREVGHGGVYGAGGWAGHWHRVENMSAGTMEALEMLVALMLLPYIK